MTAPRSSPGTTVQWQPADSVPPVKRGHMKEFVLAVFRDHSKKIYSFACSYLNAHPLQYEYECPKGDGCAGNGCDDGCPTTGWFILTGDEDSAGTFNRLDLKDGDKIMGWQEIPQWGDGGVAQPSTSPGSEVEMTRRERAGYIWAILKSYMLDECSLDCAAVGPADEKYIINTLFNSIPDHGLAQAQSIDPDAMNDKRCSEDMTLAHNARVAAIEECARKLEKSYPDHAWLNAACAAIRTLSVVTSTGRGCGDPSCKDPDCSYGKGKARCQNCGDPIADALHEAGFCGTCREMGCSVVPSNHPRGGK